MEEGAGSNHIGSSCNYHKFLSSYCCSLAEQRYAPAGVYLQLPPGTAHRAAATPCALDQCPEVAPAAKTKLIPFLIAQKATRCQQRQGHVSPLALHLCLSPEFSYLPLAFSCLWMCRLSRTQELYLCAVLLFLVGQRCIGISSLVGRQ